MSNYDMYGGFTVEETEDVGKRHKVRCINNNGYGHALTIGKEYEIEVTPRILPLSPLCSFIGDDGNKGECHMWRFEKMQEGAQ